jgi:hypothetical protein
MGFTVSIGLRMTGNGFGMSFWIEPEHCFGVFDCNGMQPKLLLKGFISLDQLQHQQVIRIVLDQQCLEFFRLDPEGLVIELEEVIPRDFIACLLL